jgi:murein DD-endopeptidase MepM/ murein hydrolase activator NlpD
MKLTRKKTIFAVLVAISLLALVPVPRGRLLAQTFQWPVLPTNRGNLGQDYAQYNCGSQNKYHTGIDIGAPETDTTVHTPAAGRIVKIQENDVGGADHGYGNTLIIEHDLGNRKVYSQYSHLALIEESLKQACGPLDPIKKRRTCSNAVTVNSGDYLGIIGGSGYGRPDFYDPHLHFEIKSFSTLGTEGDDHGSFGYTSLHPDEYGYEDPILHLHPVSSIIETNIRVTEKGEGALIRVGPGNYRMLLDPNEPKKARKAITGEEFIAFRKSPPTTSPACSGGWYQIKLQHGDFPDPWCRSTSTIPDAWICRGNAGEDWVEILTGPVPLILIDGDPLEWSGISPDVPDPEGDFSTITNPGYPWGVADDPAGDIKALYLTTDENYLYLMVSFYNESLPRNHLVYDVVFDHSLNSRFQVRFNEWPGSIDTWVGPNIEYVPTDPEIQAEVGDVFELRVPLTVLGGGYSRIFVEIRERNYTPPVFLPQIDIIWYFIFGEVLTGDYQVWEGINDTISSGESKLFQSTPETNLDLKAFLSWPNSILSLRVYGPDGTVYDESQSDTPPVVINILEADPSEWQFEVIAIDIPHDNYPFVLVIGTPIVYDVQIDIKPGSYPNSINPKSEGKIPVAILSTENFDAPNEIDRDFLTFGRTGDEESLSFCSQSPADVNNDGENDLICHFYTRLTGFRIGDTEGILKGETMGSTPIEGRDLLNIVPLR